MEECREQMLDTNEMLQLKAVLAELLGTLTEEAAASGAALQLYEKVSVDKHFPCASLPDGSKKNKKLNLVERSIRHVCVAGGWIRRIRAPAGLNAEHRITGSRGRLETLVRTSAPVSQRAEMEQKPQTPHLRFSISSELAAVQERRSGFRRGLDSLGPGGERTERGK